MIKTLEELRKAEGSVFTLEKELAESLLKSTRNKKLKKLVDKNTYLITSKIKDELIKKMEDLQTNIENARQKINPKNRGRKRKDYTPEELAELSPEEQKKYKYALWQRQSRFNRGITKQP